MKKIIGLFFILASLLLAQEAYAWFDGSWYYRKKISISSTGSYLTDYQLLLSLDTASLIQQGKMQADCRDMRFVSKDFLPSYDFSYDGIAGKTNDTWVNQAIVDDVDNDGRNELVIVGTDDTTSPQEGFLRIYNSEGLERATSWVFEDELQKIGVYAEDLEIAELDGDPYKELIVVGWTKEDKSKGLIRVFDGKNLPADSSGIYLDEVVPIKLYATKVADYDRDGEEEILVTGTKGNVAIVYVYGKNLLLEREFGLDVSNVEDISRSVDVFNGNIVVSGFTLESMKRLFVRVIDSSGRIVKQVDIMDASDYWLPLHTASVGDINDDGRDELIITATGNYLGGNFDAKVFVLDSNLNIIWDKVLLKTSANELAGESDVYDVDNDGKKEVIVRASKAVSPENYETYVFILDSSGNLEYVKSYAFKSDYVPINTFTLYGEVGKDLDGDGIVEIPAGYHISTSSNYQAFVVLFEFKEEAEIPYWIETDCSSTNTRVWIKVPFIPDSSGAEAYMYYGNPVASSKSNFDLLKEQEDSFNFDNKSLRGWYRVDCSGTDCLTAGCNVCFPDGYVRIMDYYICADGYRGIGYDVGTQKRIIKISSDNRVTTDIGVNDGGDMRLYVSTVSSVCSGGNAYEVEVLPRQLDSGWQSKVFYPAVVGRYVCYKQNLGSSSYCRTNGYLDNVKIYYFKYYSPEPSYLIGPEEKYEQLAITILEPRNKTYSGYNQTTYLSGFVKVNERIDTIKYSINQEPSEEVVPVFILKQSYTPYDLSKFNQVFKPSSIDCNNEYCEYNNSAYLIVQNSPSLSRIEREVSIHFLNVNFSRMNGYDRLIEKAGSFLVLLNTEGNRIVFELVDSSGQVWQLISAQTFTTNKPYNISVDYDRTTMRIFVNGTLDSYREVLGLKINQSSSDLYIGGEAANYHFKGRMGGVFIYNNSLVLKSHIGVLNPSFEEEKVDADETTDYLAAHWRNETISGNPLFLKVKDPVQARTGSTSLKVVHDSVDDRSYIAQNPNRYKPDIIPGKWYNLTAYYKSKIYGGSGVRLQIIWWSKEWKVIYANASSYNSNNYTSWNSISLSAVAPPGAFKADWVLEFYGQGEVLWDDVSYKTSDTLVGLKSGPNSVTFYVNDTAGNLGSSTVYFTLLTTKLGFCGDGSCDYGETCSNCLSDCKCPGSPGCCGSLCGCPSGQVCENGVCVIPSTPGPVLPPSCPSDFLITTEENKVNITVKCMNSSSTRNFTVPASPVFNLSFALNITAYNFKIIIETIPEGFVSLPGLGKKVYSYLSITKEKIEERNMANVSIGFKVEKSWIYSKNINSTTISLYRYTTAWNKLLTRRLYEDESNIYFESESPGLSIFAIAGQEKQVVIPPSQCPVCNPPSDWSGCINGTRTRTNYVCSEETNYTCKAFTETETCEVERGYQEGIGLLVYLILPLLIVGILLASLVIYFRRKAKTEEEKEKICPKCGIKMEQTFSGEKISVYKCRKCGYIRTEVKAHQSKNTSPLP